MYHFRYESAAANFISSIDIWGDVKCHLDRLIFPGVITALFAIILILPLEAGAQQGSSEDFQTILVRQDEHRFDVKASLSNGGRITGIQVLPETGSLLLSLDTGSEDKTSELRIVLPRDLIDAKDEAADASFLIIVEGEEVEYTDIEATDTVRELEIPISGGATQVEIFGTRIVPEFPIVFLVFSISLFAILACTLFGKIIGQKGTN